MLFSWFGMVWYDRGEIIRVENLTAPEKVLKPAAPQHLFRFIAQCILLGTCTLKFLVVRKSQKGQRIQETKKKKKNVKIPAVSILPKVIFRASK